MLIYHYSYKAFDTLKTLKAQGRSKDISSIKDYDEHISFFLEPIPHEFMGTVFGPTHPVWFPGSMLIEHTVLVKDIGEFRYRLVESPEKTAMYYDTTITVEQYHTRLKKLIAQHKYEGTNPKDLEALQNRFKGVLRESFALLPSRSNFEEIREKYAATVPHVMLYPKTGLVPVTSHKTVRIGNEPVPKIGFARRLPTFSNWK